MFRCLPKKMLILASNLLLVIGLLHLKQMELVAASDTEQEQPDEQQKQLDSLDLPSISKIRFELRKLDLPKESECRLFASKIQHLIGDQQQMTPGRPDDNSSGNILTRLARFIESQPSWSGVSNKEASQLPGRGRILLDYILECINYVNLNESDKETSTKSSVERNEADQQQELEALRRRVAELESELELSKRQQAAEHKCQSKGQPETHSNAGESQLERRLLACESAYAELIEAKSGEYRGLHERIAHLESKNYANMGEFRNCQGNLEMSRRQMAEERQRSIEMRRNLMVENENCRMQLLEAKKCQVRESSLLKQMESTSKFHRDCEDRLKKLSAPPSSANEIPIKYVTNKNNDDHRPQQVYVLW